jgi:hypothetical protein
LSLSASDLIQNFILMSLTEKVQTRLYRDYWITIKDLFCGSDRVANGLEPMAPRWLTLPECHPEQHLYRQAGLDRAALIDQPISETSRPRVICEIVTASIRAAPLNTFVTHSGMPSIVSPVIPVARK